MFNQKYFIRIFGFVVVSFTATFLMPMASNVPGAPYISRAAQLGLGQQAGTSVKVQLPKAQMSSERFKDFEEEFMQPARWGNQSVGSGMFKSTMPRLMSQQEAYKVLGLSEQATVEQKKAAYRELAKKYHPDIAGVASTAKMQKLQEAYDLVKNQKASNPSPESTSNQQSSGFQRSNDMEHNEYLNEQLYNAIKDQNVESVKALIKRGANPEGFIFLYGFKKSILGVAVEIGNYEIVKLLLDAGAKKDLNECLTEATKVGRLDLFDLLVLHGALVEEKMFKELISNRLFFRRAFDDRIIKSKVFLQVCEKNPKLLTDSLTEGYRIFKTVWGNNLDKISYAVIPTLLHKNGLDGLTANDVRAWYARVNKSIEKNEKLEDDRQSALQAMRNWCLYKANEPYEMDMKTYLNKKIRQGFDFFNI